MLLGVLLQVLNFDRSGATCDRERQELLKKRSWRQIATMQHVDGRERALRALFVSGMHVQIISDIAIRIAW